MHLLRNAGNSKQLTRFLNRVIEEGTWDAFASISFSFEILHWFTVTWHVCSSWAGTVASGASLVLWVCSTAQCFASFYPSSRTSPSVKSSTRCSSGRLMSHHSPKGQPLNWDRMQVFRPLHASCASSFFLLKTYMSTIDKSFVGCISEWNLSKVYSVTHTHTHTHTLSFYIVHYRWKVLEERVHELPFLFVLFSEVNI